jgi:hypothetical protein
VLSPWHCQGKLFWAFHEFPIQFEAKLNANALFFKSAIRISQITLNKHNKLFRLNTKIALLWHLVAKSCSTWRSQS